MLTHGSFICQIIGVFWNDLCSIWFHLCSVWFHLCSIWFHLCSVMFHLCHYVPFMFHYVPFMALCSIYVLLCSIYVPLCSIYVPLCSIYVPFMFHLWSQGPAPGPGPCPESDLLLVLVETRQLNCKASPCCLDQKLLVAVLSFILSTIPYTAVFGKMENYGWSMPFSCKAWHTFCS